jgi:predicted TIM-barrel fold metal-dependent hydrolase
MFETDYPHPTCLFPDSVAIASGAVRSLPEVSRRRVMSENAIRLYNLPVPAPSGSGPEAKAGR